MGAAVDAFSRHELLDRLHVVSEIFQTHVVEHPAVTAELRASVDAITEQMEALYQRVGALSNLDLL